MNRKIEWVLGGANVTITSMYSGEEHTMFLPITLAQVNNWNGGGLIQEVFPHLDLNQREFLMSGATPEEWDILFGGDD